MVTYSTLAFKTGLLPCSTCAKTASFVLEASNSSKPSDEAQHFVLNGKVFPSFAFELMVTSAYSTVPVVTRLYLYDPG